MKAVLPTGTTLWCLLEDIIHFGQRCLGVFIQAKEDQKNFLSWRFVLVALRGIICKMNDGYNLFDCELLQIKSFH
jgi:hypothetical protein